MKISEITRFFNSKVPKVQIINKNKKTILHLLTTVPKLKGKNPKQVNSLIKSDFVLGSLAEIK